MCLKSAQDFRQKLGLERGELGVSFETEEKVWNRNSIGSTSSSFSSSSKKTKTTKTTAENPMKEISITSEIQPEDLTQSLISLQIPTIQPLPRNPDPDLSASVCSFDGCGVVFGQWEVYIYINIIKYIQYNLYIYIYI